MVEADRKSSEGRLLRQRDERTLAGSKRYTLFLNLDRPDAPRESYSLWLVAHTVRNDRGIVRLTTGVQGHFLLVAVRAEVDLGVSVRLLQRIL